MSDPKSVQEVGQIPVAVLADYAEIHSRKNLDSEASRPEYGYANDPQNFDFVRGEGVYTVRSKRRKTKNQKLKVLTSFNGVGAKERELYPDDSEMVRLAIKNKHKPVGISTVDTHSGVFSYNPDVTVSMGGLNSVRAFDDFAPGQRIVYDVPPHSAEELYKNIHFRGINQRKFPLVTKRADSLSSAEQALKVSRELVRDPTKWNMAMGNNRNTDMWQEFGSNLLQDKEVSGLLLVYKLMNEGILQINPGAAGLSDADGNALSTDESVSRMAQFLGVVKNGSDIQQLSQTELRDWKRIRYELDNMFLYDGKNTRYEYGYNRNPDGTVSSRARDPRTGRVFNNRPEGQLLQMQLNQSKKTIASMDDAIRFQRDWEIGTVTVGGPRGSVVKISSNFQ